MTWYYLENGFRGDHEQPIATISAACRGVLVDRSLVPSEKFSF